MEVTYEKLAVVGIVIALLFTSVGQYVLYWCIIHTLLFSIGALGMLYYQGYKRSQKWKKDMKNCYDMPPPSIGIPRLVEEIRKEKPTRSVDKRMTGSNVIDEVLHEIMDYTWRDFLQVWYRKISDNPAFELAVRQTMQKVIIAFSDRAKEVDLAPYLTKDLVDDFASHIRLYRRTLDRVALHQVDDTKPPPDLEKIFFELEREMEKTLCRDNVCLDPVKEQQYLHDVADILLYLLLPADDFHNKPFRFITREIVVKFALEKSVAMFSDPDFINQSISWLTKDAMFTSESFLTILKTSDSVDELMATKEKVDLDIARQRSRDTGGVDDAEIKQQLSSLKYVKSMCEASIDRLNSGAGANDLHADALALAGQRIYQLPFDAVINNNIALECFIDFMSSLGAKHYIYFYFTVEGYRVTAEQQISASLLAGNDEHTDFEMLREACSSIYHQYLSEKASPRVKCDDKLLKKIQYNIKYRDPTDSVFDEIQARVWNMMQDDPLYYPAFLKSQLYLKLLKDLDLSAQEPGTDGGKLQTSAENVHLVEAEYDIIEQGDENTVISSQADQDLLKTESVLRGAHSGPIISKTERSQSDRSRTGSDYALSAHITNTGICREHGKQYAVYLLNVKKLGVSRDEEDKWSVYRRYSDFHDLHQVIQDKYADISAGLVLPSKKAFNNMTRTLIERRKNGLNSYLQTVLTPGVLSCHRGLLDLMYNFLQPRGWHQGKAGSKKQPDMLPGNQVSTGLPAIRSVGDLMRSMPDTLAGGVTKGIGGIRSLPGNVIDGVGRILTPRTVSGVQGGVIEPLELPESQRVGANLKTEDEDNIPLRIVLLLMDEVFDLKSRQQWLRRRVVAILRQVIKTMFGDSINRKIVEHVERQTSADQIAEYLRTFKEQMWPNGTLAEPRPERDEGTQMRTRVVAKAKMLGTIDDELKSFLASIRVQSYKQVEIDDIQKSSNETSVPMLMKIRCSDTTRRGVTRVFNMFQHKALNKRLVYVIFEGMLATLFPEHSLTDVLHKIHAASPANSSQKS